MGAVDFISPTDTFFVLVLDHESVLIQRWRYIREQTQTFKAHPYLYFALAWEKGGRGL
jgi:hypothetical protein